MCIVRKGEGGNPTHADVSVSLSQATGAKKPAALWGLSFFKHIFGSAAYGADPTVKEFIKGGVRRDVILLTAHALFRIVYITTDITFIFFHFYLLYP